MAKYQYTVRVATNGPSVPSDVSRAAVQQAVSQIAALAGPDCLHVEVREVSNVVAEFRNS